MAIVIGKFVIYSMRELSEIDFSDDARKRERAKERLLASAQPLFQSPLEESFYRCWIETITELNDWIYDNLVRLEPQLEVRTEAGVFHCDFGVRHLKIAIEIDGIRWHKGSYQITKDYRRRRAIEDRGFRIIGFSGPEIYHDVEECVYEAKIACVRKADRQ